MKIQERKKTAKHGQRPEAVLTYARRQFQRIRVQIKGAKGLMLSCKTGQDCKEVIDLAAALSLHAKITGGYKAEMEIIDAAVRICEWYIFNSPDSFLEYKGLT